jgi:hypothetical protein
MASTLGRADHIFSTLSGTVVVDFLHHAPGGRVCEALFSSVGMSMDRSVPFCHLTLIPPRLVSLMSRPLSKMFLLP